jgi:hypothetical protein
MSGVSGSGKSSLAFDTLYAEGQRRYVESLSTFARQFLGQLPRPDVDSVTGLSPSISIAQKSAGTNPRSTVATMTEIHDFLRVLYARVGTAHCPQCDSVLEAQPRDQIVERIIAAKAGEQVIILAPLVRDRRRHRPARAGRREQKPARRGGGARPPHRRRPGDRGRRKRGRSSFLRRRRREKSCVPFFGPHPLEQICLREVRRELCHARTAALQLQ